MIELVAAFMIIVTGFLMLIARELHNIRRLLEEKPEVVPIKKVG